MALLCWSRCKYNCSNVWTCHYYVDVCYAIRRHCLLNLINTISLLVGSSSNYACSHHPDKLGSWNSSSCWQLCTHWRIFVRFFSWFCVSYPSPVWLAGAPASSSRCSTDVQAHSVSIHISGGVSDSAYCRVSNIFRELKKREI